MNRFMQFMIVALTVVFFSQLAMAGDGHHGKMRWTVESKKHYQEMMRERHRMHNEMLVMVKATMVILKDLNHKPSPAQREKLGKMINRIDEMMTRQKEMAEETKNRMKEMHKHADN
ncbi:MAG: hypothetical protein ACE5EH_08410 [Gammaproteobacteria bacterium]